MAKVIDYKLVSWLTKICEGKLMDGCHIGMEIRKLSNQIYKKLNQIASEKDPELTIPQTWILNYLAFHTGECVLQKELEDTFHIRRSTASQMLLLLEKNGYISRSVFAGDARMKSLALTEKGASVQRQLMEAVREAEADLVVGISEEDYECFLRVMSQMEKNME